MPQAQVINVRGSNRRQSLANGIIGAGQDIAGGLKDFAALKQSKNNTDRLLQQRQGFQDERQARQQVQDTRQTQMDAEKVKRQKFADIKNFINYINGAKNKGQANSSIVKTVELLAKVAGLDADPAVQTILSPLKDGTAGKSQISPLNATQEKEIKRLTTLFIKSRFEEVSGFNKERADKDPLNRGIEGKLNDVVAFYNRLRGQFSGGGNLAKAKKTREIIDNEFISILGQTKFDELTREATKAGLVEKGMNGQSLPSGPDAQAGGASDGPGFANSIAPTSAPNALASPAPVQSPNPAASPVQQPDTIGGPPPAWYQTIKTKKIVSPNVVKLIDKMREKQLGWDQILAALKVNLPGVFETIQSLVEASNNNSPLVPEAGKLGEIAFGGPATPPNAPTG